MKRITAAVLIGLSCVACQQHDASAKLASAALPPPPPATEVSSQPALRPGNCDRLVHVAAMPYRPGEMGGDRNYYALYNQGDAVVPCLVDALDDETPIADPSEGPKIQHFQVGDLALLMLMDLEKVEYAQCAPSGVMREIESVGVQAFFDWVHGGNRKALQQCVAGVVTKGV